MFTFVLLIEFNIILADEYLLTAYFANCKYNIDKGVAMPTLPVTEQEIKNS